MDALLAATNRGVVRADSIPFDRAERVLRAGPVWELAVDPDGRVLAATGDGTYRSADGGRTWEDLGVSGARSVAVSSTGTIYVGVRPAGVYRSTDDGATWTALDGLRDVDGADEWPTTPHFEEAQVRTLATVPGAPDSVVAGVEVGGLAASEDGGETWRAVPGVPDDVHHVVRVSADEWIVSCGTGGPGGDGGAFRTTDAGSTWSRLDTGARPYVRESVVTDRCYTAANRTAPPWDPADAAVYVERDGALEPVAYPGEPRSFVVSWATDDGRVFAGTNAGTVLRGRDAEWDRVGRIPVDEAETRAYGVRSLAVVP